MDDVGFLAFAEGLINFVDERYGRLVAWIVGIIIAAVAPAAVVAIAILWLHL